MQRKSLILSSKWMILHHYSTDTVPTASHSPSDIWFHGPTRNESAIKLLSSFSQSLKISCDSETAGGLSTAQTKINVCSSKDKTVFAMGSRGEEKSWEQRVSLEEPAMLLPMLLESCVSLYLLSSLHTPHSFSWMHYVYWVMSQESGQWCMATLLSYNESKTQAIIS